MVSGARYAVLMAVNVRRRAKVRQIRVCTVFDGKALAHPNLVYRIFIDRAHLNALELREGSAHITLKVSKRFPLLCSAERLQRVYAE